MSDYFDELVEQDAKSDGRKQQLSCNKPKDDVTWRTLSIEIHDPNQNDWAEGRYLVQGADDVIWTNDLEVLLQFIRDSCGEKYDKV